MHSFRCTYIYNTKGSPDSALLAIHTKKRTSECIFHVMGEKIPHGTSPIHGLIQAKELIRNSLFFVYMQSQGQSLLVCGGSFSFDQSRNN